jgi:hypothetical protein
MFALIILLTIWVSVIVAKIYIFDSFKIASSLEDYINSKKPSDASDVERLTREFWNSSREWH